MRRKAAEAAEALGAAGGTADVAVAQPEHVSMSAACRRWAELLRRIFEVDPLMCPACGGRMRIVGFVVVPRDIDRILRHIRDKGCDARAGPWAVATAPGAGASAH